MTSAARKFGLEGVKACCLFAAGLEKNRAGKFGEQMEERKEMQRIGVV